MDTLSRKVTKEFFFQGNEEGFTQLEAAWKKALVDKVELTPAHFLLYQILRGKDWRKSFSELVNQKKRVNGGMFNTGFKHAFDDLRGFANTLQSTSPWANPKSANEFLAVLGVSKEAFLKVVAFTSHVNTVDDFKNKPAYDASKVPVTIQLPSTEMVPINRD